MNTWYYINVSLHITCAAFWIGGMLFLPLVLLPAIRNNPERSKLLLVTGLKFRFYGYIVLIILFITGLLNIYFRGIHLSWDLFTKSRFGNLVSAKIILFVAIIIISLIHDLLAGKKAIEQMDENEKVRFRSIARWTGRILLLISLVMVYLGVLISRGG